MNQAVGDFHFLRRWQGGQKDAVLQVENGIKAAGTRARKSSLELEKLMKEFRKMSLEASKN